MVLLVQVELKFGMLVGTQRKIVGARTRTNNKPTNDTSPGIKPGLQWWMTKAPTTAPALLPSTEIESEIWEQANDEQNQPAR